MKSTLAHEMHDYASLLNASPTHESAAEADGKRRMHNGKEKYSLRERQKRRHALTSVVELQKHSKHRDATSPHASAQRANAAAATTTAATSSKTKAPPLSKYRRKTANARERTRMREINSAFENLRHCVPQCISGEDTTPTNEKLTKITTLRLAMKYIRILTEVLKNPNFKSELPLEYFFTDTNTSNNGGNGNNCQNSDVDCGVKQKAAKSLTKATAAARIPLATKTNTKMATAGAANVTKSAHATKAPKRLAGKRKSKAATAQVTSRTLPVVVTPLAPVPATSSYTSSCSGDSLSSNSSHFLDSLMSESTNTYSSSVGGCSVVGAIPFPSITELTALALESDGESLHLSEHCHSPLQDKFVGAELLFSASELCSKTHNEPEEHGFNSEELEAPLELNLQFLGGAPETLDFSLEQPPTTCISPLVALDAFNPFGDFLQEYPEQSSLDLFLT